MNRTFALALVIAAASAGNAFAENITDYTTPFAASGSRAEVQAELAQYRQSRVNPWARQYSVLTGFNSQLTRAQVTAEYLAARDEVAAFTGEDSGSAYLARGEAGALPATRVAGQHRNPQ